MLLIIGSPRSGTTWVAKIFDSHPEVQYLHEPDSTIRPRGYFSPYVARHEIEKFRPAAGDYIQRMLSVRRIKTVGSTPVFRKTYRSGVADAAHAALVLAAKLGAKISWLGQGVQALQIPDLIRQSVPLNRLVVKSVSALGYANLLASVLPNTKVIILIRDPRGHVASVLRGIRGRRFEGAVQATDDWGIYEDLARTSQAKRYGIDFAAFISMPPVERLAWRWAIANEKAIEDFATNPNARVVSYRDLCDNPVNGARELFQFAGLEWSEQTEAFVKASQVAPSHEEYYSVYHNPQASATRWRNELDADTAQRIMAAVGHTLPARLVMGDLPSVERYALPQGRN